MEHHFVPQFYLRGFRDPDVPEGKGPWLWVTDCVAKTVSRRSPKSVGKRTDYYAFPEIEAGGGEGIEAMFSKLESAAAPVIKKVVASDDMPLEAQDRADLLYFMAFFVTRVPASRDPLENFAAEIAKMTLQMSASHPDYFAATMREALKAAGENVDDLTPEKIEEYRQFALDESRYTITTSPKLSLGVGFKTASDTIFPIFDRMRWAVVRATEGARFVTSDRPVSWVDATLASPFAFGLAARQVEVTFPLDPKTCVFGTWNGPQAAIKAPDRIVEQMNVRCVGFADRYLFSHSEGAGRSALDLRAKWEQRAKPK
jgi:hypothetical protein